MVTDPVCGMKIQKEQAAGQSTHAGHTYYFCSAGCQKKFEANPQQYTPKADGPP